jgi:hypothetical protein
MESLLQVTVRTQITLTEAGRALRQKLTPLKTNERGEGVISAAIAVMIMAVIGGLMFVAYRALFKDSETKVKEVIDSIN